MGKDITLKKIFLITMIISLSLSALIGIIIFLIGTFGEIEARILLTTLTIGGFSLTALSSSALYDKHRYVAFSGIGIIFSILGFLISTLLIWEVVDFNNLWKTLIILIILSVSTAHTSLLLLIKSKKSIIRNSLILTLTFITIVAFMLIFLIITEINEEFFFRLLGVFAILDALGTIVTPILLKVTSLHNKSPEVSKPYN